MGGLGAFQKVAVDDAAVAAVRARVRASMPALQRPPGERKWPSTRALLQGLLALTDAIEVCETEEPFL